VEFVIQLLREKKKEIQREYKEDPDFIKTQACDLMTKQIDKAIWTLEYEHYWKHMSEKQVCDAL
jgi:hypothetical protein